MSISASTVTRAIGVTVDALAMAGDTLYVWDAGDRKLQRYDDITTMSTTTPTPDAEVKIEGADVFKITNVLDITVVGGDVYATTFQKLVFKIDFSGDPLTEIGDLTPNSSDTLTQGITAPDSSTIAHYDPDADAIYTYNLGTGAINTVGNPGRGRWMTHDGSNYILGDGSTIQQAIGATATYVRNHQALGWYDQSSPQQLMLTDTSDEQVIERVSDPFGTPSQDKTWALGDEEGTYVTWNEPCEDANGDTISLDSVELDQVKDDQGNTTTKTGSDRTPSWLNWKKVFNSGTPSELLVDLLLESSSLQIGYEYTFELVASDDQALDDLRTVTLTVNELLLYAGTELWFGGDPGVVGKMPLSTSFDVTTAGSKSTFALPGNIASIQGLAINGDGTKLWVGGDSNNPIIEQYTMSTPWDPTSASKDKQKDISGQTNWITGFFIKPDGSKLFVCERTNNTVLQYSFGTTGDLDTLSFDKASSTLNSGAPTGIFLKPDGAKMFIVDTFLNGIESYSLSSVWDVGAITHVASNSSISTPGNYNGGCFFRPNGERVYYYANDTYQQFHQETCDTPWDISQLSADEYLDGKLTGKVSEVKLVGP